MDVRGEPGQFSLHRASLQGVVSVLARVISDRLRGRRESVQFSYTCIQHWVEDGNCMAIERAVLADGRRAQFSAGIGDTPGAVPVDCLLPFYGWAHLALSKQPVGFGGRCRLLSAEHQNASS
jgi:hypothetical protein